MEKILILALLSAFTLNGCTDYETIECGENYKLIYTENGVVSLTTEEGKRLSINEVNELNNELMNFYEGDMKSFIEYIKDACNQ